MLYVAGRLQAQNRMVTSMWPFYNRLHLNPEELKGWFSTQLQLS